MELCLILPDYGEGSSSPLHKQLSDMSECLIVMAQSEEKKAAALVSQKGSMTIEQQDALKKENADLHTRVAELASRGDRLMSEKEKPSVSQHSALTLQADSSRRISDMQRARPGTQRCRESQV